GAVTADAANRLGENRPAAATAAAPLPKAPSMPVESGISAQALSDRIDQFLASRGYTPPPSAQSLKRTASGSPDGTVGRTVSGPPDGTVGRTVSGPPAESAQAPAAF